MKILVMDTSTWALAVAIVENGQVLGEVNTYIRQNHSLRLMPAVEQLFKQVDVRPNQLDGVAVAHGPGSYTGVRIGVTTAKVMAWSLNVSYVGISSLRVIAQNMKHFQGRIIPMFDARRGQVYTGTYTYDAGQGLVVQTEEDRIQLVEDWAKSLQGVDEPLVFIGEGSLQHEKLLKKILGKEAYIADRMDHYPRGYSLAELSWKLWDERVKHIHPIAPEYLQLAEAEKKWVARLGEVD